MVFQGVDSSVANTLCYGTIEEIWNILLPRSVFKTYLRAQTTGFISHIDAQKVGEVCVSLGRWLILFEMENIEHIKFSIIFSGAGRSGTNTTINHSVGIQLILVAGDSITKGDDWICVYHSETELNEDLKSKLESAISIDLKAPELSSKILKIVKPTN